MKSQQAGKNISEIEVLNVSPHGIWIFAKDKEYFLDYKNYPWFQNAKLEEIFDLELHHQSHLYWPKLDIDLDLEILEKPEKFPRVYKTNS